MKIYLISINGKTANKAYTSLKGACEFAEIKYYSANRGKRIFVKNEDIITITEAEIIKIKGRENNSRKK